MGSENKKNAPRFDTEAAALFFKFLRQLEEDYVKDTEDAEERRAKVREKYSSESLRKEREESRATNEKMLQEKMDALEAYKRGSIALSDSARKAKVADIQQEIDAIKQREEEEEKAYKAKCEELKKAASDFEESLQQQRFDNSIKRKSIYEREKAYRDAAQKEEKKLATLEATRSDAEAECVSINEKILALKTSIESESDPSKREDLKHEQEVLEVMLKQKKEEIDRATKNAEESKKRLDGYKEEQSHWAGVVDKVREANKENDKIAYYDRKIDQTKQKLSDAQDNQAELQANRVGLQRQIEQEKSEGKDTSALEKALEELTQKLEENATEIEGLTSELDNAEMGKSHQEKIDNVKQQAESLRKHAEETRELNKDPEYKQAQKELRAAKVEAENAEKLANLPDAMEEKFKGFLTDLSKTIDKNTDSFYEYQAHIESRLQGSNETYQKMLSKMSAQLAFNPFVKQTDMLAKIKDAVDVGIAYNADLRAFLATVSDDIASTFNAFDASLLRIIRIQQADTTAARLGMESSLTKLFNHYFSDTSYLSEAFDGVTNAILEASSQLTKEASMEFEYIVQKWLGALYSVGFSQESINTIAQGINYLGTGDVEKLTSNDALNSLLAMSATRAGIPYAEILTEGLDASTTNDLLRSMVEYLQSIANNTDNNQVTKSAYTNLFGVSMTDLKAVSNLKDVDIANIHSEFVNYKGAMDELTNQFKELPDRIHFSQWITNIVDNAAASAATGIASNVVTYGMWKIFNVIEGLTGGIHIPAFSIMGNMVDLSQFTIEGMAKAGIAGLGLMGNLISGLFSGGSLNPFDIDAWGFDEVTSRGKKIDGLTSGISSGFSESKELNMVGSSSSDDIKNTGMADSADDAKKDSEIVNKDVQDEADIYKEILGSVNDGDTTVLDEIKKLSDSDLVTTITDILATTKDIHSAIQSLAASSEGGGATGEGASPVGGSTVGSAVIQGQDGATTDDSIYNIDSNVSSMLQELMKLSSSLTTDIEATPTSDDGILSTTSDILSTTLLILGAIQSLDTTVDNGVTNIGATVSSVSEVSTTSTGMTSSMTSDTASFSTQVQSDIMTAIQSNTPVESSDSLYSIDSNVISILQELVKLNGSMVTGVTVILPPDVEIMGASSNRERQVVANSKIDSVAERALGISNDLKTIENVVNSSQSEINDNMSTIMKESDETMAVISEIVSSISTGDLTTESSSELLNKIITAYATNKAYETTYSQQSSMVSTNVNSPNETTTKTVTVETAEKKSNELTEDTINAIITALISKISDEGGLSIKFSNDQSTPLWVQEIGGY